MIFNHCFLYTRLADNIFSDNSFCFGFARDTVKTFGDCWNKYALLACNKGKFGFAVVSPEFLLRNVINL